MNDQHALILLHHPPRPRPALPLPRAGLPPPPRAGLPPPPRAGLDRYPLRSSPAHPASHDFLTPRQPHPDSSLAPISTTTMWHRRGQVHHDVTSSWFRASPAERAEGPEGSPQGRGASAGARSRC